MSDLINIERIVETSEGDREFEQDLIEIYVEDAQSLIERMQQALSDQSSAELRSAAHTLKGSSANIGAQRMREVSYDIERQAADEKLDEAAQTYERLKQALTDTQTAYEAYLAS